MKFHEVEKLDARKNECLVLSQLIETAKLSTYENEWVALSFRPKPCDCVSPPSAFTSSCYPPARVCLSTSKHLLIVIAESRTWKSQPSTGQRRASPH